jgi:hypothetical protein
MNVFRECTPLTRRFAPPSPKGEGEENKPSRKSPEGEGEENKALSLGRGWPMAG